MLKISGTSALSDFRINRLLNDLKAFEPSIAEVSASFIHFIDIDSPLNDSDLNVLTQLLNYGSSVSK